MKFDYYLKKIYNVAFRLTGDETKAANLAFNAVNSIALNLSDKVDSNMFNSTAKEVCRLFLADSNKESKIFKSFESFESNEHAYTFQEALLSINPLSRTTIVWRDVLGRSLEEITVMGYNKKELYFELNNGRRFIKEFLNEVYINETGA